ncbi:MAG: hypothetical protein JNM24_14390 [Bdellovibrionaceae bacterium]|nr:hypothetical protein [Pseudobdellovibrionaceae bacterium]
MIEDQKSLIALELERLKRKMQNQKYILTDTMIGESLVAPTTLTFSLFEMSIQNGNSIAQAMKRLGFPFLHRGTEPPAYERIFGRPYINVTAYTQASIPFWPINISANGKIKVTVKPSIVFLWPLVAYQLAKIIFKTKRFATHATEEWQALKLQSAKQIVENEKKPDLLQRIKELIETSQNFFSFHIATDFCFAGIQILLKVFHRWLKLPHDINVWDPCFKEMSLIQFHLDLWKLSHEKISKQEFIENHGSRSHKDWEISAARFYEIDSELENMVKGLKAKENFEAVFQQQQIEKTKRQFEIKEQLRTSASFFKNIYLKLGQSYSEIFILREASKRLCFDWIALFRRVVLRIQEERAWDNVVFHLSLEELKLALEEKEPARLNDLFTAAWARKQATDCLSKIKLPGTVDTDQLDKILNSPQNTLGKDLVCLSPGVVEGQVIVVNSPSDCHAICENHIVVTRFVDPQYIPFMIKAKGWILEQSSLLGHSSILAREALIPVISSYKGATDILVQGTRVLLDANVGEVRQVQGPEAS